MTEEKKWWISDSCVNRKCHNYNEDRCDFSTCNVYETASQQATCGDYMGTLKKDKNDVDEYSHYPDVDIPLDKAVNCNENGELKAMATAAAHWEYVSELLLTHTIPLSEVRRIKFHYISAMIHGWRHGVEWERTRRRPETAL